MANKEKIPTYNALKGIGSIGILFSHMAYLKDAANPFWMNFYKVFMSKGAICSTLFVLSSGFFLDYAWKDKKFREYIVSKLRRIYPLAFIVLLAAIAVDILLSGNTVVNEGVPVGSGLWFFNIFANLFLIKAFIPIESVFYSFHGPSWYISMLFVFYLIAFPFVKGLHGKHRDKWAKSILFGVLAAYTIELVICILVRIFVWNSLWLCYVNPWFRIFGEGLAGILLCENMDKCQQSIKNLNVAEILAVVLFIAAFLIRNIHLNILSAWIQIVPMAFLLIAFRSGNGMISRLLKTSGMQLLGNISFELYMTHAFVYEGLPIAVGIISSTMKNWLIFHAGTRFVVTFVLCILVACITHSLISILNKILFAQKG